MGIAPSRRVLDNLFLTDITVNGDVVLLLTTLNLVIKLLFVKKSLELSNVLYLIQVMFMNGLLGIMMLKKVLLFLYQLDFKFQKTLKQLIVELYNK
jgi:hypothetical protein